MVEGIIENTHIILSKITKFIWFLDYYNFSKIEMYFEIDGVYHIIFSHFINKIFTPIFKYTFVF